MAFCPYKKETLIYKISVKRYFSNGFKVKKIVLEF